jgi:hypothetical protein
MKFSEEQKRKLKILYDTGFYDKCYPIFLYEEVLKAEEKAITQDEKMFENKLPLLRKKLIEYVSKRDEFREKNFPNLNFNSNIIINRIPN